MASYTLSDSTGFSPTPLAQDQGNPAWSSQNGRDPNNWINAEQALIVAPGDPYYPRAYVLPRRLGLRFGISF